jgi:hypothetical protein
MLRDAARPWAEHDLAGEVKNSRGENQGITASEHAGAWDRQLSLMTRSPLLKMVLAFLSESGKSSRIFAKNSVKRLTAYPELLRATGLAVCTPFQ